MLSWRVRLRMRIASMSPQALSLNLALAALLIGAVLTIGAPKGPGDVARTATVTRGTVTARVTGSGNAVSSLSTPVNAAASGTITAINVKPGDTVKVGDVLATIDPANAQANLRIAQAGLDSALAAHRQAAAGPTEVQKQQHQVAIAQAQQAIANSQAAVQKAEKQLELDKDSTATAIDNAKTKLGLDEKAQDTAVTNAQRAYDACRRGSSSTTTSATPSASGSSAGCSTEQQALTAAKQNRTSVLANDQQAITAAEQQQKNTLLQSDYAITTAKQAVIAAQGQVKGAQLTAKANLTPQTPDQIAQAKAAADSAQVQVEMAQRAVDQTEIKAPQAGVVLSVNGKVGESTGPNNGGSEGSSGSSGGSSTSNTSGSSSSNGSGSSGSGSSGDSEFISIANLSQMAVTANIAESDAAKIELGQHVDLTFPATNATAAGSVTQITPQSTVQNNVVLYPVTVSLDAAPPNVGVGATASLSISSGSVDNVLMAPSAAITTVGTNHTATVRRDGADTVVPMQVGMVGDATTEITSGLAEGDVLVLPSPTAAAPSTNRGLPPRVGGR